MHATPEPFRRSQSLPVAIHLHRVPIVAYQFPGWWASALPSCLGNLFCTRSGGFFRSAFTGLSKPSYFSLATPGPVYGPSAPSRQVQQNGVLRYARYPCLIQVETEPPGSRPPSPGTHAHRTSCVATGAFWSPGSDEPFQSLSRFSRFVNFQPRGTPSVGVSHTTLLSIAIAVVIRRHAGSACYP